MIFPEIDLENLSSQIKRIALSSHNEEELKIGIAPFFDDIAVRLGLERGQYERQTGTRTIIGGRPDALYGRFILEYKSPALLSSARRRSNSVKQVKEYIQAKSLSENLPKSQYFASIIDGMNIMFIQYSLVEDKWRVRGPFEVSRHSVITVVEAISGLRRKALDGQVIIDDLGPASAVAKEFIKQLFNTNLKSPRSQVIFEEWYRTFLQVVAYKSKVLNELSALYHVDTKDEFQGRKLLFCVQTYFALIMKLIAAEVVQLYSGGRMMTSFLGQLDEASMNGTLLPKLRYLEEAGGFFQQITGIKNFLEGDFFSWYLDEWNPDIESGLIGIVQRLANYEPSTADLAPERIKDLFKVLYQKLLPKKLRHAFGEYYTPDWLASLILEDIGISKDSNLTDKRILDPACGSGTFLINVIRQIRLLREKHNLDTRDTFRKVISGVVGYDLNPLAILASRANYIIALGDLLVGHSEPFEVPVFLTDSVSLRATHPIDEDVQVYELSTKAGTFRFPAPLAQSHEMDLVLELMKTNLEIKNDKNIFKSSFSSNFPAYKDYQDLMEEEYALLLDLEKKEKNRIWIGILRNTFAPLMKGQFDYVIGNPPWINWESLPPAYREMSKPVWQEYHLLERLSSRAGMGSVKRDVAMLFVLVCAKKYLKEDGKLGMLCPYTLFKVTAGEGFRNELTKLSIQEIIDLVEMKPFEGATTRTSAIFLQRGAPTTFPIKSEMWRPVTRISDSLRLDEVKNKSSIFKLNWFPVDRKKVYEPWLIASKRAHKAMAKAIGRSAYIAHAGVYTALNGAFWIRVVERKKDESFVVNLADVGKTELPTVEGWVENSLIYPLMRGRDISAWIGTPSDSILLPVDKNGETIQEDRMRIEFPKAYKFLLELKTPLLSRKAQPYKSWFDSADSKIPFYSLFNASSGFGKYKVVWQYISGRVSGKGRLTTGLVVSDDANQIIPNERVMVISSNNYRESLFILGVLNSTIAKLIVASYSIETHISADIMNRIRIPKYDGKDKIHLRISELAESIRNSIIDGNSQQVVENSREILDLEVAKLFLIRTDQMSGVREDLSILIGNTASEEEDTQSEEYEDTRSEES